MAGPQLSGGITFSVLGKDRNRPNIVFLLADDQNFASIGAFGNPEAITPNLDRLCNEGLVFENHYDSTSICMASRACVMTGKYEFKTGCNFSRGTLSQELFNKSYPVLMRQAGYYTGFAGKFGYGVTPQTDSSGKWKSDEYMPIDQFNEWGGWTGQGSYTTASNEHLAHYAADYPHSSAALGAFGRDFIRNATAASTRPFCLSISFKAPHNPVSPDPRFDDVYADAIFTKPGNYGMENSVHLPEQAKSGRQYTNQGYITRWYPDVYDVNVGRYFQLVHGIDSAVGMILDELEARGVADNTVIVYTSDNGYFMGEHGYGGKVLPYEEGSRVPLIIVDPRSASAGQQWRTPALSGSIDLAPTMLELAGISVPDSMDGVSLAPCLSDSSANVRDSLLLTNVWGTKTARSLGVVTRDWKYLYWYHGGYASGPVEELYNMNTDAMEMNNLAGDAGHSTVLDSLRQIYDGYIDQWAADCVPTHNYPNDAILHDRRLPWSEREPYL